MFFGIPKAWRFAIEITQTFHMPSPFLFFVIDIQIDGAQYPPGDGHQPTNTPVASSEA
jgi:hypothetical protein